MMSQSWTVLLVLSSLLLLLRPAWATQYASWLFYDNECYGTPYSPAFAMDFLGRTYETTFPGGHFIDVNDGCGPRNCFAVTYSDNCNACLVYYGSGCYNINLGYNPSIFEAWCEPCEDIPAAKCAHDCF
ncbi:hypothetical protein TMatcc_008986 [Talaromyces marneffei ATCC 18224]|uniref:uncharacterized protein n=1 Tax=Talaromyces marneffei TaxID=37727 RepID=UPI0012A9E561|nr:uncharacterized protein EYB26_008292 [Talaromyces marneffei]KAE8550921.1 hypothetical protein EYB25_007153 [Talaromyces marneffei]QGA20586.1 hypothetical protein EYB26_008292 [Talaromyces marneffei]